MVEVENAKGELEEVSTKNVLLATGSEPICLPGFELDEERFVSSTGALELKEVPEHLIVIGAGVIGLELGSVYRRMGSKVTVIEFFDKIAPSLDQDIGKEFQKFLKKEKFKFMFNKKCIKGEKTDKGVRIHIEDLKTGKSETVEGDVCLLSTGRAPYTKNLGLENLGIEKDKVGRVKINDQF